MIPLYVQDYGMYWDKEAVYEAVKNLRRNSGVISSPIAGQYFFRQGTRQSIHEFTGTESRIRYKLMQIAPAYGLKF